MDLSKLRTALGMAEDAKEADVFAKAAEVVSKASEAGKTMESLGTSLAEHGLMLEGGKLVEITEDGKRPSDKGNSEANPTERESELLGRIAELEKGQLATRLSAAKAQVEGLIKAGVVPPAMQSELTNLLAFCEKANVTALSADGQKAIDQALPIAATITRLLNGLPKTSLMAGSVPEATDEATRKQRTELASSVARRVQPRKEDKK
ncbi:MAG: hypothetical protein LLG93_07630 [Deltaproteobacteria bacterium]|nr:hypothetical protein [Deltaproteobacteria bacterium]